MPSALTNRGGSTTAWRELRKPFEQHLEHSPILCRHCHQPIHPGQPWDLGHSTARAIGGTDEDLWPEHAHCNRSAGATLGNLLRRQHHDHGTTLPPSRDW